MDSLPLLVRRLDGLLAAWQALPSWAQEILWLVIGLAGLIAWAWCGHWTLRRLAGHRRFRGRWFSPADYQRLMQVLWEDQQQGSRVMSPAELKALREYRYGRAFRPLPAGRGNGYFDG